MHHQDDCIIVCLRVVTLLIDMQKSLQLIPLDHINANHHDMLNTLIQLIAYDLSEAKRFFRLNEAFWKRIIVLQTAANVKNYRLPISLGNSDADSFDL
jgi:hypothetical protein